MSNERISAGVIGLGAMGAPMARNLAAQGLLGAIWNRSSDKAEALAAELDVPISDSPKALARSVDIVLTCVSADADLLTVVDNMLPGLSEGKIVLDTSTVSGGTAREAARRLAAVGAALLDAPVSGGVEGAIHGTLSIMVGGDEAALERARPVLEAIGARITHMGPVGAGQATKAVNQVMVAGIAQAVTEALAFGEALGLDSERLVDVTRSGAAGSWFLEHRGKTMLASEFDVGFKLELLHKDLGICQQMADDLGGQLPLVDETRPLYAELMNAGHGSEDISALIRRKRREFGPAN